VAGLVPPAVVVVMVTPCIPVLPDVTVPEMLNVDCDEFVGFVGFVAFVVFVVFVGFVGSVVFVVLVVSVPDPDPPPPQPVNMVVATVNSAININNSLTDFIDHDPPSSLHMVCSLSSPSSMIGTILLPGSLLNWD
jgi:hypothetical protein